MIFTRNVRGFTLVELAVAILIIGILMSAGYFGFHQWRDRVAAAEVKSDLSGVAAAMESAKNWSNGYPTIPAGALFNGVNTATKSIFTQSKGVTLTYYSGTDEEYCIDGASVARPAITMYVSSEKDEPLTGTCAASMPIATYTVGKVTTGTTSTSCSLADPWLCGYYYGLLSWYPSTGSFTAGTERSIQHDFSCSNNNCQAIRATITSSSPDLEVAAYGSSTWGSSAMVGPFDRSAGLAGGYPDFFKARLKPNAHAGTYEITLTLSSDGNLTQTQGTGAKLTLVKE